MKNYSIKTDQNKMNAALEYYAGYLSVSQAAKSVGMHKGPFQFWLRGNSHKIPSIIAFNPDAIKCSDCNRRFIDSKAAKTHERKEHRNKPEDFCNQCGLQIGNWNKSSIDEFACLICKPLIQRSEFFNRNAEKKTYVQQRRFIIRQRVIEHYGGKCNCCGELTYEFLTMDHINNDGAVHRRQREGNNLYHWLINNNFPNGFQILCYNCNCAKGAYGQCPHQDLK